MAKTTKSTSAEGGEDKTAKSASASAKSSGGTKPAAKTTRSRAKATDAKSDAGSSGTKKSDGESPFDKKFLDEQRKLLHAERERYFKSAVSLKAEADALVESREPGDVQFDEESGEGDTLSMERERENHTARP